MDKPLPRMFMAAIDDATGVKAVPVPTLGGSVPMYLFAGEGHQRVTGLPIANHDNDRHTYDENIRIGTFWEGVQMYAGTPVTLGRLCARGC